MTYLVLKNDSGCELAREVVEEGRTSAETLVELLQNEKWLLNGGDTIEVVED